MRDRAVFGKVTNQKLKQKFSLGRAKMNQRFAVVVCSLCLLVLPDSVFSQDIDIRRVQKNIDVFAGLLEQTLGLNEPSGPFSRSLSGIESKYLFAQGVVVELRHPLASRRNRMGFASLNSAMQALQARRMPFGPVPEVSVASRSAAPISLSSQSLAVQPQAESLGEQAADFYSAMMDRIASVDYSLMVNNAIQQASNSARSLRVLEGVDEETYLQIREQLEGLRSEALDNQQQLREFLQLIEDERSVQQSGENAKAESEMLIAIDGIYARLEPLRDAAVSLAEDLRQQAEQAEQEYIAQWQTELERFESQLYQAMCDYGATLRELPDGERISIILRGLGEENEENRLADKVHVFSKSDISACQSGNIDVATLQARSIKYNY
jgi:hypothetical protein